MQDREFDELIKTRLQSHDSAVPADMWQRITVTKKKRRIAFILFFLLGALLLAGIPAIYYLRQNLNDPQKELVIGNDSKHNKFNHVDSLATQHQKELPADRNISNPAPLVTNPELPTTSTVQKSVSRKMKYKRGLKSRNEDAAISSTTPLSSKTTGNIVSTAGERPTAPGNNAVDSLAKKQTSENKMARPDSTSDPETKPNEAGDEKLALELFLSPDMTISGINAADKSYEQTLKKAGSMQFSYTAGARISYAVSGKLFAKIGVHYTRINEQMSFKDAQGNNVNAANRYTTISVPLLISYKIASTDNLRFFVNTGTVLNIVSSYKGMIPSISGQAVDIKNNDVYDKNVSVSLFFSLDISRKMNRRTDVFAEPWLNYRLKNMVTHAYAFDQRIHAAGLSLGLRYRLFRNNDHQF